MGSNLLEALLKLNQKVTGLDNFTTDHHHKPDAKNQVCNVAVGDRTTLSQLFDAIQSVLKDNDINDTQAPTYREFRKDDVRHSQADISKANRLLGYAPSLRIGEGVDEVMLWYVKFLNS